MRVKGDDEALDNGEHDSPSPRGVGGQRRRKDEVGGGQQVGKFERAIAKNTSKYEGNSAAKSGFDETLCK